MFQNNNTIHINATNEKYLMIPGLKIWLGNFCPFFHFFQLHKQLCFLKKIQVYKAAVFWKKHYQNNLHMLNEKKNKSCQGDTLKWIENLATIKKQYINCVFVMLHMYSFTGYNPSVMGFYCCYMI